MKKFLSIPMKYFFIVILVLSVIESKGEGGSSKQENMMRYLENGRLKLGIDLSIGGAVTYLTDQINGGENMINSFDWGRQIQLSYYSGPWPYIGPNGEEPAPTWIGLGWNPIQSGDAGGHRSKVLEFEYRGTNTMYVRCIPMQWPHTKGVAAECEFECIYTLNDNVFTLEATIINKRSDKTQYRACNQEMPALYTNGPWYKLVTYLGDEPFQDKPVTVVVDKNDGKGWPWVHFYAPERWVALMDETGKGIGVYQPEVITFNGGFHGGDRGKGIGGEKSSQTGHIAPIRRQILDHNIRWTYKTSFVLGTVEEIRQFARENQPENVRPEWIFNNSRKGWYYEGDAKDTGWPIQGMLNVQVGKDARLVGPETFWKAENAPVLEIEGAFTANGSKEIMLSVEIQPVGKSDFTDWLNWSEGIYNEEKERQDKASKYPPTSSFTVNHKVRVDGKNRVYRVDLSSQPQYKGAVKNLSVGFPGYAGTAKIKRIGFAGK